MIERRQLDIRRSTQSRSDNYEVALIAPGRYNERGRSRLKSILLLPRTDWFVMIAVALGHVEAKPRAAQCEMEFQT